jgi:hypothetical protein
MCIPFSETTMPRSTRGPRPANSPTEDRQAIEQRARDAAAPFAPEKKGQWPFAPEETSAGHSGKGNGGDQTGRVNQPDP